MNPVEVILNKLPYARRNGRGWMARCPAHEDRRPSLSISQGEDGRVLMHCHAGCTPEAVTEALGLNLRDLMPPCPVSSNQTASPRSASRTTGTGKGSRGTPTVFNTAAEAVAELERRYGKRAAMWTYCASDGEPIGVVVRWDRPGCRKDIRPVSRAPAGWVIGGMPTPRPLYRLPELAHAKRVYVTEGEKAADAVVSLGLVATTSPHGSRAAGSADWSPLAGKECIILPDNDKAGAKYAAEVAAALARLTPATKVKVLKLDKLPPGGDAFDFIESYRNAGVLNDADIRAHLERWADRIQPMEMYMPAPATEPFHPFPLDALPNPIHGFVKAVAAATGTDPAFAALAALVVTAGCIGNRIAVLVKSGWVEPAVLWGVQVGRSGSTKSPVLKLVTQALFSLYKAERRAFAEAMQEHLREAERFAIRKDEWKRAQRNGPPTDPPEEPERPIERRLVVSDVTIEKLGCLLEENPLGLLLVRDELAAWVGAFDRYASGGKGSDQPAWLSMYDAAPITIDRKSGKGTIFVERAAVSVLGSIQPGTLTRMFGTAEREAGLLARLLVAYPPERPALWTEADLPDDVADAWQELLCALLALPASEDELGDPRPRFIPIGIEAKSLWIEWHDHHARELADVPSDDLAAHYAKLKGACARIALLFACVEVAAGGDAVAYISADAMRRAIAVTEWFKREARRVYGILGETDEEREQRRLAGWIERRGGSVTVRDLTHGLRQYRGDTEAAKSALDALAEAGLGRWTHPASGPEGGRPSPRFELVAGAVVTKTLDDDAVTDGSGSGDGGGVAVEGVAVGATAGADSVADEWGEL